MFVQAANYLLVTDQVHGSKAHISVDKVPATAMFELEIGFGLTQGKISG
jgi:hypothetical protein